MGWWFCRSCLLCWWLVLAVNVVFVVLVVGIGGDGGIGGHTDGQTGGSVLGDLA